MSYPGPLIAAIALVSSLLVVFCAWLWRRTVRLERANRALARELGELQRTEESLKLFHSLMHQSAEAILVIDPDSAQILYVNEQAVRQLGYSTGELLALRFTDLIAEGLFDQGVDRWPRWVTTLEQTLARVVEGSVRRKDGQTFPVELSVSLVTGAGRRFVVAIAENISRRRHKDEAINMMHDRLIQLSSVDGLTGIANRRLFDERLDLEWKRAVRDRSPVSLVIADIDHFKLFNDRYGHLAGDDCLEKIAEVFSGCIGRPADLVARFGGEELAVLLPETVADGASGMAERLRRAVERLGIPHDASPVSSVVTVSLGVGTTVPARDAVVAPFLRAVDAALYRAKRGGRNRVERAETLDPRSGPSTDDEHQRPANDAPAGSAEERA